VDTNVAGVGALRALTEAGWKPGMGMSLIVYDGIPTEIPLPYTVTGVTQATGQASGRAIADLVIGVLAGKRLEDLHVLAQPTIAAGETDGPPPPSQRRRTKAVGAETPG
jgi:LacI family transcriptional regulator